MAKRIKQRLIVNQIRQYANAAGLSLKNWADKFNKFNPKLHSQRGPITFDPDAEAVKALQCQDIDPLKSAGYVVSEDLQEGEIEFLRQVLQSAPDTAP